MISMKRYMAVKQAQRQGLTVSEAAVKLGRDRKAVRKYFRMDRNAFLAYLERMAERGKGFEAYRDEILDIYRNHEGRIVYSSAVYDFLHEKHGDLPGSESTLRNYLAYLKAAGLVGKGKGREYRPVEPLPYGKQAQIDFGLETTNIGRIYFAVIILSRSRYRFVAAQEKPFTTLDVIGHLLDAFEYFGGIPEELVLDQDRTMLIAENLGDLATTKAFSDFVAEQELRLWVCRAADPESKGKVENSVKFVKTNFFSSRTFDNFDSLATDLRKWLIRANGRISQATRMIPLADQEAHEKPLLRPLRASIFRSSATIGRHERRKADQRSLISVAGSKYSVPSSYRLSEVEIECVEGFVRIYDPSTALEVAEHPVAACPGSIIANAAHYGDRKAASEALRDELRGRLPDNPDWAAFIDGIWTGYRRYFREHAIRLAQLFARPPDPVILGQALAFCRDSGLSAAQELLDAYTARGGVLQASKRLPSISPHSANGISRELPIVETRSLADYQRALDAASRQDRDDA
jgi:hypothetical protein